MDLTEVSIFRYEAFDLKVRRARQLADKFAKKSPDGETETNDRRQHAAALRQVEEAEALRDGETLAIAFMGPAGRHDALLKLSRYRASIERTRNHALEKLERLQATHGRGPRIRRRGRNAWAVLGRPKASEL